MTLSQNETTSGACLAIQSCMHWLTKRLHSVRFIFTISLVLIASLSNNLAGAQQMCAELFGHTNSYNALKEMSDATDTFLEKLAGKEEMTIAELEQFSWEAERTLEDFLNASGFSYKRVTKAFQTRPLKDNRQYFINYGTFELTGSRHGDAPSPPSRRQG